MADQLVTKKFLNDPDEIVDDALKGIASYNPNVTISQNCSRVVVRSHYDEDKVSIVSGGGSGHEPFAAGFVGAGGLTAAVAGNIFASPPTRHVLVALEEARSEAGVVLVVINYTGDRLNFGLAAERFKAQGNKILVLVVGDDDAIDPSTTIIGKRGLAGAALLFKIVGAMAENGKSLEEIENVAGDVKRELKTIGCALSPCSIPGSGPLFDIPHDQYELGLGIHGEAGKERVQMESAKDLINRLLGNLILKYRREQAHVLLLNNLGGVSQIEMMALQKEILSWAAENNLNLARLYTGTYMTSLDCHGIHISALGVWQNDNLLGYLDAETDCPGWNSGAVLKPDMSLPLVKEEPEPNIEKEEDGNDKDVKPEIPRLKKVIYLVCKEMWKREKELNDLDSVVGDGDCGSTFRFAADVVWKAVRDGQLCLSDVHTCMQEISVIFEENVGGTTGALYAILLSVLANHMFPLHESSVMTAFRRATEAVEKHGGARQGDRTMVDTMRSAINEQNTRSCTDWPRAVAAAEVGAKNTVKMRAYAGRASYTSATVQTKPDAGAMALAYWMRAIWNEFDD